jgi:hypothetical protein
VANGALLQLDFMVTNRVAGLVLNGVSKGPGVYNNTTDQAYLTGPGSLSVPSPIAPNPTNLTFSVSGGILTINWPADHLGWILQSQTNLLSTGLSTNWNDVPGSETNTSFSASMAEPVRFFRLRRPY